MRGKLEAAQLAVTASRIIPAHAGQTSSGWPVPGMAADHPRACGANPPSLIRKRPRPGSSPRMRGKLRRIAERPVAVRIIPAHAGQTGATAARTP